MDTQPQVPKKSKAPVASPASTEVDTYIFIKQSLRELGWDVRNPHRCATGRLYTQNECLEHPQIKACLGLERLPGAPTARARPAWFPPACPDRWGDRRPWRPRATARARRGG